MSCEVCCTTLALLQLTFVCLSVPIIISTLGFSPSSTTKTTGGFPNTSTTQPLDTIPPTYLPIAASDMGRNDILSPWEVEGLIADGHIIVIWEGKVLRLNGWLDKHPGGRLAVLHMVGRDASDEINV